MNRMKNKNTFLIIILVILGALGTYYFLTVERPTQIEEVVKDADLRLYTNEGSGFSFSYPADWVLVEHDDAKNGLILTLETSDTQELVDNRQIPPNYRYNLALYRFPDINNMYAQGGAGPETRYDYESVDEFLNDATIFKTTNKIGDITIDGVPAHEVIVGGFGAVYGVFVEQADLFLMVFERAWDKDQLGDEEKEILTSFDLFRP